MTTKTNEDLWDEWQKNNYDAVMPFSTAHMAFINACEIKDREIAELRRIMKDMKELPIVQHGIELDKEISEFEDFIISLVESCDMGEASDGLEEKHTEILRRRNDKQ